MGSIADLQAAALFALGFFGFLRWDDLSRLTPENLVFTPTHLTIFLEKRKNDQFREGSQMLIARSEGAVCSVGIVERFLRIGEHDRQMVIWHRVQKTKNGVQLRKEAMSYSRAAELVKKEIKAKDFDLGSMGCIACSLGERLQRQLQGSPIGCSKDRVVGTLRQPRTTIYQNPWTCY